MARVLICLFLFCKAATHERHFLRFFNLDVHACVIADVQEIFESFGHEVVSWNLSGHGWIFGKKKKRAKVDVVNERTWDYIDPSLCERFFERYGRFLDAFDGFIVTHNASFTLLYERFGKPIVYVNSSRYENSFTKIPKKWLWLDEYLKRGAKEGWLFVVSNNKADAEYLKRHTGIESEVIPSLCLYTQARYTGGEKGFIVSSLYGTGFEEIAASKIGEKSLIGNPRLSRPYRWQELYDYQGVVHFPYQISTMSIFEQYSANVPLFFPTKAFLKELAALYPEVILSQLSFYPELQLQDSKAVDDWIEGADFYDEEAMPYIQYFSSFEELRLMLKTVDCQAISVKMEEHNRLRKERVYEQWKNFLTKVEKGVPKEGAIW